MTRQKAGYPLDYSKGSADAGKDRLLRWLTSPPTRSVTESAEEIAGKVAEQAREYGEKAQEAVKNLKPYQKSQAVCRQIDERAAHGYLGHSRDHRVRSRRALEEIDFGVGPTNGRTTRR